MIAPNSSASARQLGDAAEIAVHREDAVGDQDLLLRRRQVLHDLARRIDVLVREDLDRRLAQAAAVDDAGVIQLVGDDHVVLGEHRGDGAGVGGEAALKDDDGFDVLELGEPPLELHVHFHGSRDGAHRAGADAELLDRVERGLLQLRMRRQAEIVVRRQIDDRLVIVGGVRFGLAFEDAQLSIQSLLLQASSSVAEKRQRIFPHISSRSTGCRYRGSARAPSRRAPSASSQPYQRRRRFANAFRCTTTCVEPESFSDCHAASGSFAMRCRRATRSL